MKKSELITTNKGFFIGDPCYVFEDGWGEVVTNLFDESKQNELTVSYKDHKIGMSNTAYGDGVYPGSDGEFYPVDAGLLGITPLELVETSEDAITEVATGLGKVVNYKGSATISYDEGTITIEFLDDKDLADIVIQTSGEDEEEYDEDADDEYVIDEDWL